MENNKHIIMAYLADWDKWETKDIDASKLTHLNYSFAKVENDEIVAHFKKFHMFEEIRNQNPHLKTLISIGGWSADGFSDAAFTKEGREKFAVTGVKFMRDNKFDGIDLDWEYPCSDLAGIKARKEDKQNFTLLLKRIREELNKYEKIDNKKYMLTTAAGAGEYFIEGTEITEIIKYLDYLNLMTYDLIGSYSLKTGQHTGLYASEGYKEGMYTDKAIKLFLNAGVPKEKLILGASFYGRMWDEVKNPKNNGLNEMAEDTGHTIVAYEDIVSKYNEENGFKRYWDDAAKAPYVFDGKTFIGYEDEESLKLKCDYLKELGLPGIMFWEYSLDKTHTLINKIYDELG